MSICDRYLRNLWLSNKGRPKSALKMLGTGIYFISATLDISNYKSVLFNFIILKKKKKKCMHLTNL